MKIPGQSQPGRSEAGLSCTGYVQRPESGGPVLGVICVGRSVAPAGLCAQIGSAEWVLAEAAACRGRSSEGRQGSGLQRQLSRQLAWKLWTHHCASLGLCFLIYQVQGLNHMISEVPVPSSLQAQ